MSPSCEKKNKMAKTFPMKRHFSLGCFAQHIIHLPAIQEERTGLRKRGAALLGGVHVSPQCPACDRGASFVDEIRTSERVRNAAGGERARVVWD